jgi:hypothetical protein
MKKLTLILAALVLTLGFSQCKKTETPTTDEGVKITLTAGYGNGAKTSFDPANGTFAWTGTTESPEYIYVGGNSTGYLGYLTSTESGATVNFSGTITPGAADATLYFFYLGKGDHAAATSVDFSNQDGTLENVTNYHIAISEGVEYAGQTSFSTTLNMKMAIAYFDVDGFKNANEATETVYLHGDEVYSSATIDYTNGTITGNAKGYINLGTANNGKYVALIPSVSTETTLKFDSNSKWGAMNFLRGIQAGRYYSNSGAALTVTAGTLLEGTIPGLFSVSATKMVRFSKGNLQYNNGTWNFHENQYDRCFTADGVVSSNYTSEGTFDLFGWGTSGYNHGATNYQPWNTGFNNNSLYYAYGEQTYNLYDQTGQADWGYNAISNGGNTENSGWRTPTNAEWGYVFNTRTNFAAKWGHGNVNGVNGMILLPDEWTLPGGLTFTSGNSSWANVYTSGQWAQMEANGALFLPAAGFCEFSLMNAGSAGNYWSSSYNSNNAHNVYFSSNYLNPQNSSSRYYGRSVRLIHNAGLIVNTDIINDVTAGGSIFSGWTNDGGNPWDDPTPGSGGNTLGGWNNDGNDPWGN